MHRLRPKRGRACQEFCCTNALGGLKTDRPPYDALCCPLSPAHSLRGPSRLTKPARTSTSPTSATATTSTSRVVHHLTTSVDFSKRSSRPFFASRSSMTFSSSSSSTAHAVPTRPGPSRPPQTSDPPMFIAIIRQVLSPAFSSGAP
jgi:hypothetical protein